MGGVSIRTSRFSMYLSGWISDWSLFLLRQNQVEKSENVFILHLSALGESKRYDQ